jgi:hypothetical protein
VSHSTKLCIDMGVTREGVSVMGLRPACGALRLLQRWSSCSSCRLRPVAYRPGLSLQACHAQQPSKAGITSNWRPTSAASHVLHSSISVGPNSLCLL